MSERVEFSRRIPVGDVPARGADYQVEASASERQALAHRLDLVSLDALSARLRLQPIGGGPLVRLTGRLEADLVQSCVVTLEPVPAHVEEEVEMTFGPPAEETDGDEEEDLDLEFEGDDPPDPFVDGAIDLGEAVAEYLALALDPFPRKPGAAFIAPAEDAPEAPEKVNPFAVLAKLHKNDG